MKIIKKENIDKHQKNGIFFRISWIMFLSLISILLARYILVGINDMLAVGKSTGTVMVEIPDDASVDTIAGILKNNGVISEKEFFRIYAKMIKFSGAFSGGIYELDTNMDYQAIINRLKNQSNINEVSEITFTEGMNILDYAQLLESNRVCKKDEFLKLCKSNQFDSEYSFIKDIEDSNERIYKLEGYLFPDTYKFYQGEDPSDVIRKILNNFNRKIIKKNTIEGYSEKTSVLELAKSAGLKLDELMNIASLIQAEAANKNDMYLVSSVIHNRLKTLENKGQSPFGEFSMGILRIDSTIYYPYKTKSSVPKNIAKTFKSDYDTYKIEGLPPGPICNPGMDAIVAALSPADTEYYYYCHSKSGEAFYAKTNDIHISNLRKAGLQ